MKKKYITIIIIALVFLGIFTIDFINKEKNQSTNSIEKSSDIEKDTNLAKTIEEYSRLTEFDYKSQIQKNGYISKDDALKIAAIKDKNNIEEYGVSKVVAEINTNGNNEKYWFVQVRYSGHTEGVLHHYTNYIINYYTGEELPTSGDGVLVNVDGPSEYMKGTPIY